MMFLSYVLLNLLALILAAAVSPARARPLWLALIALGWTVGQFNTLIEAVAFSVMPLGAAMLQLAFALVATAILAAIAVTVLGKWRSQAITNVDLNLTPGTLAKIMLAYQLLYWTAGTLVWPFVADFYADNPPPPFYAVAALQIPRALIFVLAAWLWLRTGPRHAPLVLAIVFAVIGAIAPMLPDNPYMPPDVRFAHGIETGASNFLFGLWIAWLMMRPKPPSAYRQDRWLTSTSSIRRGASRRSRVLK